MSGQWAWSVLSAGNKEVHCRGFKNGNDCLAVDAFYYHHDKILLPLPSPHPHLGNIQSQMSIPTCYSPGLHFCPVFWAGWKSHLTGLGRASIEPAQQFRWKRTLFRNNRPLEDSASSLAGQITRENWILKISKNRLSHDALVISKPCKVSRWKKRA